jgi:hypothetical protein
MLADPAARFSTDFIALLDVYPLPGISTLDVLQTGGLLDWSRTGAFDFSRLRLCQHCQQWHWGQVGSCWIQAKLRKALWLWRPMGVPPRYTIQICHYRSITNHTELAIKMVCIVALLPSNIFIPIKDTSPTSKPFFPYKTSCRKQIPNTHRHPMNVTNAQKLKYRLPNRASGITLRGSPQIFHRFLSSPMWFPLHELSTPV